MAREARAPRGGAWSDSQAADVEQTLSVLCLRMTVGRP
jgi:hypothetical protein